MPNAGGVMRIENQNNVPSLQDGFLRLEDQMKVQGLELTGQKSDPGEDRYQQNRYEDGGPKDAADGADGAAEGSGPGVGAYVGAAGTALSLGKMAFGKPDVDTSGMTAPEEIPSKGSAALSGAMAGASAGMAFGPWGAAIGGVVGGAAGLMGNAKAEKAQDKAHLNYTSRIHDQATGMYELGGTLDSHDASPVNGASELVTMFEGGGTHEQNSLGGIPQGMGSNGKPNLVEEGETKFEDYIFSNNINMDGTYSDKEDTKDSQYRKGGMLKRADGSYSKKGLWDNIRANKGSGKKPTKAMLAQERKINKKEHGGELHDPPLGFGEGVTDSKRARDLSRANYKNELETNPNQLDGESSEQYALRSQQFQNRQMENTSDLEKAYLNMKGNQDSLDMIPRIAADVATSPVDLAYYLKQQLDTNDTNKYKSKNKKNQEHFEGAKSLIDLSAMFTGLPITSLGKQSAFNLSKKAAPIAAPIMNAALRELGIEATSEEIGQIGDLANSYDQYKTKDLSLLTDLTESKKNTMDELMKAIRKQKRLAAAKKKNNKKNKA